jgi:hypothetical protein
MSLVLGHLRVGVRGMGFLGQRVFSMYLFFVFICIGSSYGSSLSCHVLLLYILLFILYFIAYYFEVRSKFLVFDLVVYTGSLSFHTEESLD